MPDKSKGPFLIVHKGNQTGRIYEFSKKIMTIGRDTTNDIVIDDNLISRLHVRIICLENEQVRSYVLEDLNSTNGTFLNGKPLSGASSVAPGDEIVLAQDVYLIIKDGLFRKLTAQPQIDNETQRMIPAYRKSTTRPIDNGTFKGVTLEDLSKEHDEAEKNTPLAPMQEIDPRILIREPTEPDRPHIFISYSRIDLEIMQKVAESFFGSGLRLWVDKQNLIPGEPSWRRAIQEAIERSSCVVVILSPDAKRSKWVEAELDYAETQRKKIFCILARGDRTTSGLLGYTLTQWVDIQQDYDAALNTLVDALWKYLKDVSS